MTPTSTVAITPTAATQNSQTYSSGAIAFTFYAVSGGQYTFSTCGASTADTYLRLYSGSGGTILVSADDNCGTQSQIVWTCPTTGNYSVLLNNYPCAPLTSSTFMSYSAIIPGCTNSSAFGTASVLNTNAVVTIATNQWQSEYSTINSVVSGNTYISSYSLGGYITVRAGSYNGQVVAVGNSPLTWTAISSGSYFVHYNTNSTCGTLNSNGTSTIQCSSCPAACVAGDPTIFGSNSWNVYCYGAGDATGGSNAWASAQYKGYYTMSSLNFDTRTGQTYSNAQSWGTNGTPSSASGYQGCSVGVDNHSYIFKRQGFTCGSYQINIPNHDDIGILLVDGVEVWRSVTCCATRTAVWTGYLGSTSTIEFRISEGGGGSDASLEFVSLPITATITGTNPNACGSNGSITLSNMQNGFRPVFQTAFNSTPTGATTYGTATVASGELSLTPAANDQTGSVVFVPSYRSGAFTVNYSQYIGGGSGADGLAFTYGPISGAANGGSGIGGENGWSTGLVISFDTYTSSTNSQLNIYWNGGIIWQSTVNVQNFRTASFVPVRILVNTSNQLSVIWNSVNLLTNYALPAAYGSANKSTWNFGMSARTGGANDAHKVSDFYASTIANLEYSTNGTTWATTNPISVPAGTYTVQARPVGISCPNSNVGQVTITPINTIDWGNLQFPASGAICSNGSHTVYGRVYKNGVTTLAGQQANLTVQFGYNSGNTNPNTWANWSNATWNAEIGNNDEYLGNISGNGLAGTYYYAFRYRYCSDGAWFYGGYNATGGGFWDGFANISGVLTVSAQSVGGTATGLPSSICSGQTATLNLTGYTGSIQWQQSADGVNGWTSIQGAAGGTTFNCTTAALTQSIYYRAALTNGSCSPQYSNVVSVTVNPLPAPLTLTGSSYCSTTSNGGTVTSSGSTVGVNYQLFNSNNDALTTIAGSGNALTWSSVLEGNGYYVIGSTDYCSSLNSNTVNVSVVSSNNAYVYYADADGDTYGSNTPTYGCSSTTPSGYLTTTGDCDDAAPNIYPTATELCGNDIDENCSGESDDMPSYYRTIADGNWGDASTWQTACAAGITYTTAAYAPPSYYTGVVNILANHDVIIPANGTTYQTGTLDIDAGGSLTMTGNDYLNSPTTTTTNGVTTTNVPQVAKLTVTLLIDNAGTLNIGHQASLVQSSTTAANVGSGNINIASKLTGTNNGTAPNGRYWYIGSPMNNTSSGQFFDSQSPVWTRLWTYNASNNSWGVVIHSQTNTNSTLKLIPGIGYLYRAGANKTITYTGTAVANLNNNLTGNLLAPTQDATLVPVTGYNSIGYKFVANPYPSHIDWRLVTRTGLNVSYWIRNAANTAYEAYNATTNVSTSPSGQTTRYIAPMQGFWVYAFNTSPSLRIDNTDRVHSTNVLHTPLISQVVRLKLNDGKSSDYAVVYENELASNDFEETDTDKMFDYDFHQLYTMEGEHELSLNGLLNATAKGSVDMGMVVPNNGPYTLEATDLEMEEAVILEDKFNHTFQDLKVNPIYSFTSNAGTFNNRFVLHFTNTETVEVGETVGETDGVSVYNTTGQQVKVWVTNTAEYQGATVKVYDAIGNLIERKNMTSNELLLDLDIANGIYVVEVTGDSKVFTKKIFISK